MPPQPLPLNPYNPNTEAPLYDAFNLCILMEADAGHNGNAHRQMFARCLGYLMLQLPQKAKEIVANEIVVCYADFEKMAYLAQMYIDHLIRLCESSNHQHANSSLIHFQSDKTKDLPLLHLSIRVALRLICTALFLVKRWNQHLGTIKLPKDR